MTLEYTIHKKDYVALYVNIASKQLKKSSPIFKLITPLLFVYLAYNKYQVGHNYVVFIYLFAALVFGLYSFFGRIKLLEKQYGKIVDNTMSKMFGSKITLTVIDNYITSESKISTTKVSFNGIREIDETDKHCFVHLHDGGSIAIPKEELNDFELNAFIEKINNKNLV